MMTIMPRRKITPVETDTSAEVAAVAVEATIDPADTETVASIVALDADGTVKPGASTRTVTAALVMDPATPVEPRPRRGKPAKVDAPAEAPVRGYDTFSAAKARRTVLEADPDTRALLIAYEAAHRARPDVMNV